MSDDRPVNGQDQRSNHLAGGAVLIYAYGSSDGAHVKIGKTSGHVSKRRRSHEGRGPTRQVLHFLAGVWGCDSDETTIHRHFSEWLMPGEREWFTAADPLVGWLRWLRQQWFVADTEEACSQVSRESSSFWLPSAARYAPPPERFAFDPWDQLTPPEVTGDDFYTHPDIIDAARDVMGQIDLDPASHPTANSVVRASNIYTIATNGLTSPWHGRVWCNPPFGKWEQWGPKIVAEWRSGRVDEMCVLLATRTLTAQCVAPVLAASSGLCILRGRVPFWGPKATSSPDDGHAIVYFGANPDVFARRFELLGSVFSATHTKAVA